MLLNSFSYNGYIMLISTMVHVSYSKTKIDAKIIIASITEEKL